MTETHTLLYAFLNNNGFSDTDELLNLENKGHYVLVDFKLVSGYKIEKHRVELLELLAFAYASAVKTF